MTARCRPFAEGTRRVDGGLSTKPRRPLLLSAAPWRRWADVEGLGRRRGRCTAPIDAPQLWAKLAMILIAILWLVFLDGALDRARVHGPPIGEISKRLFLFLALLFLAGCVSYPPALTPTKGQGAAQQDADARECDHQVHGVFRSVTMGWTTAWSDKEREEYVACMQAKGYTRTR
jgi:D-serine deaminase-like pyridoxal phosphate-dependent protein